MKRLYEFGEPVGGHLSGVLNWPEQQALSGTDQYILVYNLGQDGLGVGRDRCNHAITVAANNCAITVLDLEHLRTDVVDYQ